MSDREVISRFLFLQGPIGPCFRMLADNIRAHGHEVVKVNLWGGDVADYPMGIPYRGSAAEWPQWIANLAEEKRITDLVLFGDQRPAHREAIEVLRCRIKRIHVLEEGYIRPNWITLDSRGANWNSGLPRDPKSQMHGLDHLADPKALVVGPWVRSFLPAIIRHYLAGVFMKSQFPGYRHHRCYGPVREGVLWIGRFLTKPLRKPLEARNAKKLEPLLGGHFVFPMQLEGDSQLHAYSRYASIHDAMEEVVASFMAHAEPSARLFIKPHPLDPAIWATRRRVFAAIRAHRAKGRVYWIDRPGIGPLLKKAKGLVTVNSSCGLVALRNGVPTKVLGKAFWNQNRITDQSALDDFWQSPVPPDKDDVDILIRSIMRRTQINGGYYSARGLACALDEVTRRILGANRQAERFLEEDLVAFWSRIQQTHQLGEAAAQQALMSSP